MNGYNRRKPLCPTDEQFELLSLDSCTIEEDKKRAQIHLQQCKGCRERFQEFDGFYSFFLQELSKPITNSALDFAKEIGFKGVKYGLFECEPVPDKTNGHGFAYRTNLRFIANGTLNAKKLTDFSQETKLSQNLTIRFMTDPACEKTILFMHSKDYYGFNNYQLTIPGIVENAQLSNTGTTKIQSIDINKLNGQIVYLSKDDTNSANHEKRVAKIRNAIQF